VHHTFSIDNWRGKTELLILQSTSFCNIDCTYCYLPNRATKNIMDLQTLRLVLRNLSSDAILSKTVQILWHAGEPITVGIDYYKEARDIILEIVPGNPRLVIQTNGLLIDENWCQFFKECGFHIGLSIDGPEEYHDRYRKTRSGRGTFNKAMRAATLLAEHGVDFDVLSVLTRPAIMDPSAVIAFAESNSWSSIGFNIEETEGVHVSETLSQKDTPALMYNFFQRMLEHCLEPNNNVRIREIHEMLGFVNGSLVGEIFSHVNNPFRIITVDTQGLWSTFCPELIGTRSERFKDFKLGDLTTGPISSNIKYPLFEQMWEEVSYGIKLCRDSCDYFSVCGGGRPANKFGEHGRFDVTETAQCRTMLKPLADATVDALHKLRMPLPQNHEIVSTKV
jgi:uncharacterized protein